MNPSGKEPPISETYYMEGPDARENEPTAFIEREKYEWIVKGLDSYINGLTEDRDKLQSENTALSEALREMIKIAESHTILEYAILSDTYYPDLEQRARKMKAAISKAKALLEENEK